MFVRRMSLLLLLLFVVPACRSGASGSSTPSGGGGGGGQYSPDNGDNPVQRMFRQFSSSFPPYANPFNFIPPQAFPPGGAYMPYGGPYYGGPYYGGMGYAGPFTPGGFGQPNPAYGNAGNRNPPGAVPVLDTRLASGQGAGGSGNSVVKTSDGRYASVSVQSSPDGKPVYREQTVTGPDSYGTAFAYSSG